MQNANFGAFSLESKLEKSGVKEWDSIGIHPSLKQKQF